MKNRLTALLLILILCLSLTGCSKQSYHAAIDLYNEGHYDAAANLFAQLGDYEDSAQLQTLSQYWAALSLMEEGDFSGALPRFIKLGSYEDAAARATECKYQMAIAEFEADDLETAESYFLEQPQYRQTQEYLRRITWQKLFDAVSAAGAEAEDGVSLLREQDGKVISLTAAESGQLILSVSAAKDTGFRFYDALSLALNRDSLDAVFTASSTFAMDFVENEIGSAQTASGTVNISTCAIGTQLVPIAFQMTVTDNQGITSTSTDPADCLMTDAMSENLSALLAQVPLLLADSGIELTLADIGFPPIA